MSYLQIAQYMAASAFITIAVIHLLVWIRARSEWNHLLFALTSAAAGANAIAEDRVYRAETIETMSWALRWYVATSGIWAIALVSFIVNYAKPGKIGRLLSIAIVVAFGFALVMNLFSPASFLYSELTGLREILLPWEEQVHLAIGQTNPLRVVTEIALFSILAVVASGSFQFWRRQQPVKSILFGASMFLFLICFGTHAFFVDTGRLNSPYLSTYGFLALVGLTSYDLAGEVMRMSQLTSKLAEKELQLRTAVADERSRIASDLHDSVTQTLFSTAAIADALPAVWQRRPEEALSGLEDLKHLTKGALAEMRSLLLELHPATLCEKDLGELLRQLALATAGRSRIPVDVEIEGSRKFPDDVQVTLYRVAQESLNNIAKHSHATQAWLRLTVQPRNTTLTIRDNGRGFDEQDETAKGMGLELMRERVDAIDGQLKLESKRKSGTTVKVYWPASASKIGDDDC